MGIQSLIEQTPAWLSGEGEYPELVISSRARLARNLRAFHFPSQLDEDERQRVLEIVRDRIRMIPLFQDATFVAVRDLSELDRQFLIERHLMTRDLLKYADTAGLIYTEDEMISVLINEEDHLRIQVMASGLALREVFQRVLDIDRKLGLLWPYAFHPEFGYLTSCPTNTGLGLRLSILAHLPGIVLTKHVDPLLKTLVKRRVGIRGLYGEGSDFYGNIFQIYTQETLGVTEEELLERFQATVDEILESERKARKILTGKLKDVLMDRIERARATLEHARLISFDETAQLVSFLRLAVGLGYYLDLKIRTLNELLLFSQPAHIQKLFGQDLDPRERDQKRASYIRAKLQAEAHES